MCLIIAAIVTSKKSIILKRGLPLGLEKGVGLGALAVSEVSPLSSPLSSSLDVNSSSDGAVIVDATLSDVDTVRFDSR